MADKAFREAVGAFNDHGSLEKAINDLTSAGWDHADLSLLGSDKTLLPYAAPASAKEAADAPETERGSAVSDSDVRQGRVLLTGLAGVAAAFLAAGATVLSGGTAAAALIGAAAAGTGAGAVTTAIGKWIGDRRSAFLDDQIEGGGILLWVVTRSVEEERRAMAILKSRGAANVHIHEVPEVRQRAVA